MKRKIVCFAIILMLGISVLACGRSQEDIIADNLQNEYDIDKEEAEEFASEIFKKQNDINSSESSVNNEENSVNEVEEVIYAEPTQEILDADFEDFKVQIDSKVYRFDYDMTTQDFIAQFDENDFKFIDSDTSEPINMDKLISPDLNLAGFINMKAYYKDELCFFASFLNCDMERKTITLKECFFRAIDFSYQFSGAIYFAKGIPYNNVAMLDENENFTFNNLRSYFESIGLTESLYEEIGKTCFYTQNGDMEYIVRPVSTHRRPSTNDSTWVSYCSYMLNFTISPDTAKVNNVSFEFFSYSRREYD